MQMLQQVARAAKVAKTATDAVLQGSDEVLSNSDRLSQMSGEATGMLESGASYLGGLLEDGYGLLDDSGGLEALANPATALEDLFGTYDDAPGHDKVRSHTWSEGDDHDATQVSNGPTPGAPSVGISLQNGTPVFGGSQPIDFGPVEVEIGGFASPLAGILGGEAKVETDAFTLGGGTSVDMGPDGIQAATGKASAKVAGKGASASGGIEQRVGEVETTAAGMYAVTWTSGYGLSAEFDGQINAAGAALGMKDRATTVGTRTFDTAAEAEAFRAELLANPFRPVLTTASTARDLDPGEKIAVDIAVEKGLESSLAAIVAGTVGVTVSASSNLEIESLGNGRVHTSMARSASSKSKTGIAGGCLGLDGYLGFGFGHAAEIEWDLTQPVAAALFTQYQATGYLPANLPPGVKRIESDTSFSGLAGTGWDLGFVHGENDYDVKHGSHEKDGERHSYIEGGSTATESLGIAGFEYDSGSQAHRLRIEDGKRLSTHSIYDGRDAVARGMDDLFYNLSFEETYQKYGHQGGHFEIQSDYDLEAIRELGLMGWAKRLVGGPDEGALGPTAEISEVQQEECMDLADAAADGDTVRMARVAAFGGGDCHEMLRHNVEHQTHVRATHPLIDSEGIAAGWAQVEALEKGREDGSFDRDEVVKALVEARGREALLRATGLPSELMGEDATTAADTTRALESLAEVR